MGAHLASEIGFAAADVRAAVIKDSGHWIMEEQPEQRSAWPRKDQRRRYCDGRSIRTQ
jgi:hypothetical protein